MRSCCLGRGDRAGRRSWWGAVGGSRLALTAAYADIWNGLTVTAAEFRERSDRLDGLITDAGRRPEQVRRTMTFPATFDCALIH